MWQKRNKTIKNGLWRNTIGHYSVKPNFIIKAKDHDQISKAIKEAEGKGKKVRPVGSGHAFSNVAVTNNGNYLINMHYLDAVRPVVKWVLKEELQDDPLVWVQAGVTIRNLNKALHTLGFSITNMGGVDHQTISGAISTGTHGTGIEVPAIHGMVRAIQLITHKGEKLQLEREDGITKNDLTYNGDFKIVRDDDFFNAAVVSLGAMGVIYAYVLRAEYEYWLKEVNIMMTWGEAKEWIKDRNLLKKFRGVKVLINPYNFTEGKDGNSCIVSTHEILYKPQKVRFSDTARNLISQIVSNWFILKQLGFLTIKRYTEKCPERMPKIIETALKNLKDKGYVNTGHKVLHQGGEYAKERAYDCELSFDAEDDDTYIKVVDAIIANAEKLKNESGASGETIGHYHTSPISFRYVQHSDAFLAPEYQRDVCAISIPTILNKYNDTPQKMDRFIKEGLQLMLNHGGAPHWGKINWLLQDDPTLVKKVYPGLKDWQKAIKKFYSTYNKDKKNTFHTAMTEELKLII